ncbi:hypothetical protein ABZW67_18455 [Streptomyces rubiginosohelvolus]|uniref:hypothetical protein n=1 Tax=Streptomyces rubiginosohelvolus TaxID=67362 RepID=UPI0033B0C127
MRPPEGRGEWGGGAGAPPVAGASISTERSMEIGGVAGDLPGRGRDERRPGVMGGRRPGAGVGGHTVLSVR